MEIETSYWHIDILSHVCPLFPLFLYGFRGLPFSSPGWWNRLWGAGKPRQPPWITCRVVPMVLKTQFLFKGKHGKTWEDMGKSFRIEFSWLSCRCMSFQIHADIGKLNQLSIKSPYALINPHHYSWFNHLLIQYVGKPWLTLICRWISP